MLLERHRLIHENCKTTISWGWGENGKSVDCANEPRIFRLRLMEKLYGFTDPKKPEITPYPAQKIYMLAIAENSFHKILRKREKSTD